MIPDRIIKRLEERKVPYQLRPHRRALWAGALLAFAASNAPAQAPPPVRVRGQITGLEGNALSVKSREGKDVKITLADDFTVAAAKKITVDDIKPGDRPTELERDALGKRMRVHGMRGARTVP